MHRFAITAAAVVALALPAAPANAHYPKPPRYPAACGDQRGTGAGYFDVHARRVRCEHARWVAKRWSQRTLDGEQPRRVGRFRCRYREDHAGAEYVSVRCFADGGRRAVSFHWGS